MKKDSLKEKKPHPVVLWGWWVYELNVWYEVTTCKVKKSHPLLYSSASGVISLGLCSSFVAKKDHAIREMMTWLAFDFVLSEGGLCRSLASLLLQSHLNPVTRYSSGWLEMTQDEAVGVKWFAQGHTASECQVSEVRFELRSSWLLHWCSIHCTT